MSSHCFFHKNLLFCFPSSSSFFPGATPPLSPFLGALLLPSLPVLWFFSRNARIQSWSYSPHPHYNSRSGTRPRMGQSSFPDILNLGQTERCRLGWNSWKACFLPGDAARQGKLMYRKRRRRKLKTKGRPSWLNLTSCRNLAVSTPVTQVFKTYMRCSNISSVNSSFWLSEFEFW